MCKRQGRQRFKALGNGKSCQGAVLLVIVLQPGMQFVADATARDAAMCRCYSQGSNNIPAVQVSTPRQYCHLYVRAHQQVDSFISDLRRMEEDSVLQEAEHIKKVAAAGTMGGKGGKSSGTAHSSPAASSHVARMPLEVRACLQNWVSQTRINCLPAVNTPDAKASPLGVSFI